MRLPGYDEWKLARPYDDDGPVCERCGLGLQRDHTFRHAVWYCERCDPPEPEYEYEERA